MKSKQAKDAIARENFLNQVYLVLLFNFLSKCTCILKIHFYENDGFPRFEGWVVGDY